MSHKVKPVRNRAYIQAVSEAQEAIRLYYGECDKNGRHPLTWDTAEIAVQAAAVALGHPYQVVDQ